MLSGRRTFTVMRSLWYSDSMEPFEEKSSEEIEAKHIELYKDLIMKSFEMENSVNTDVEAVKSVPDALNQAETKIFEAPKALVERIKFDCRYFIYILPNCLFFKQLSVQ